MDRYRQDGGGRVGGQAQGVRSAAASGERGRGKSRRVARSSLLLFVCVCLLFLFLDDVSQLVSLLYMS